MREEGEADPSVQAWTSRPRSLPAGLPHTLFLGHSFEFPFLLFIVKSQSQVWKGQGAEEAGPRGRFKQCPPLSGEGAELAFSWHPASWAFRTQCQCQRHFLPVGVCESPAECAPDRSISVHVVILLLSDFRTHLGTWWNAPASVSGLCPPHLDFTQPVVPGCTLNFITTLGHTTSEMER